MPEIQFRLLFVSQEIFGGLKISSSLANPGLARLVDGDTVVSKSLVEQSIEQIKKIVPSDHFQLTFPEEVNLGQTKMQIPAPEKVVGWDDPFHMTIYYLWWQLDKRYKVALVPGLNQTAIAVGAGEVENEVRREIRNTLMRNNANSDLRRLVFHGRFQELQLHAIPHQIDMPTPREVAEKPDQQDDNDSTLKKIGQRLNPTAMPQAWFVHNKVRELAERLTGKRPESVLLVGQSGVGKSAVFHELVRTRSEHEMSGHQFWQTDGSRLIAGMSGYGQWQQRCTDLIGELEKNPAVIHFGNLIELIEVGRGGGMKQGIADFLRPFIVRGKILAITECTRDQLALIDKQSPQLLDAFHHIEIESPDAKRTGEILLEMATNEKSLKSRQIEPAAITAANQLHARFATYSARPGRVIRFFRNLAEDIEQGATITPDEVTDAFANETGLPQFLLRDSLPLNLNETRQWFGERIIGQPEPIDLVVDLMAIVKSSLNRAGRPIASLMFIGPTGVGKTQMAKALAEFMYRDEKKMVRFDMSEYKDPYSAGRLIGGFGDGDGLLTGKIRENPFTVLLLDEFEKAHPSVFDLFLQVLGEGRLTDGHGRLVDFSTTVIIMTSNLGAESFRESSLGFAGQGDQGNYKEHFVKKVRQFVRPEFFNRIDRVVPFAPLAIEAVEQIARRELELVKERFGLKSRDIKFKIHKSAPAALARMGYDARYGARPLKRTINNRLVEPLARQLNDRPHDRPANISLHAQSSGLHFGIENRNVDKGPAADHSIQASLKGLAVTRRRARQLVAAPISMRIRNDLYRHQRALERSLRKFPENQQLAQIQKDPALRERQQMIEAHATLLKRIDDLHDQVAVFERETVMNQLNKKPIEMDEVEAVQQDALLQINRLMLELFLTETKGERRVTLVTFGRHPNHMRWLLKAWSTLADQMDYSHKSFELRRHDKNKETRLYMLRPQKTDANVVCDPDSGEPIPTIDVFAGVNEEKVQSDLVGYAMTIVGDAAFQVFSPERGRHHFRKKGTHRVQVETTGESIHGFVPTAGIEVLPEFNEGETRRLYDMEEGFIKDLHGLKHEFKTDDGVATLALMINRYFLEMLEKRILTWN